MGCLALMEKGLRDFGEREAWWRRGKQKGTFNLFRKAKKIEEEGTLPQALLPLIPDGATRVNERISVVRENGEWTYLIGGAPIFRHSEDDRRSFRMFTAQLVCQGVCRQPEIVGTFGVSTNSVKRSVKKYREEGVQGFYQPRKGRGATVMTEPVTARAQELLGGGCSRREVAGQLGVAYDTLRKAINHGRLREPSGSEASGSGRQTASDKSERSVADRSADMGIACTRPGERVLAAVGMLHGAPTRFEECRDVSFGGVLCALPALAANGLFEHLDKTFPSLGGYYWVVAIRRSRW